MYNSIYPTYAKSYLGINNRQITRKQDDEKSSQSSKEAENSLQKEDNNRSQNVQNQQGQTFSHNVFPNGERTAIDYSKRSINIAQVLVDFKNTTNAIGAPDEIKAEVNSYLSLIENQSQKSNPNPQIIQSNLRSASQILDEYITNTLKKPSKVVENWVDALLLQHIEYKSNKSDNVQPVELPTQDEVTTISESEESEIVESTEEQTQIINNDDVYVPLDNRLKSMFIQAKKYTAIDNKEQALYAFQNVLDYAEEIGDDRTAAMAHYEQGRLYDDFNMLDDALYNYDRASKQSSDNNIKAKSHLYMAKIYDDYVNFEPAVNHYCAAVSFAGEADNLKLQTKALSDLTIVHTSRYDKNNALMFMSMTDTISKETDNEYFKSVISAKNARCCEKLNEKSRALEFYAKSSNGFSKIDSYENLAKNYVSAAEIMLEYGNKAKAKSLLSKAYSVLQECDNPELKQEVVNLVANI